MKKALKKLAAPFTKRAPREIEDIMKEYQELMGQAAREQYLAYVHNDALEKINKRLVEVNTEANERNQINAEAVKKLEDAKKDEKKDVTA